MAWTAPMTAVANATFTAAQFNAHVRDNLLETGAAKATTQSRLIVVSATNSLVERIPSLDTSRPSPDDTTTSSSYVNLGTVGPQVTVTTGTQAMVWWRADMFTTTADASMRVSVAVSGATTVAANDTWALCFDGASANSTRGGGMFHLFTGLTAGSNTFTVQYKGTGTQTFSERIMSVLPL